jgi:putative transposase
VIRSYRYRIVPTKAQERRLLRWLDLTRELYNNALEERKGAWEKQRKKIHRFDQYRQIAGVKEVRPEFADVPVAFLRGALKRIDCAFNDFFGRCRRKEKPGYPRFKSAKRWHSLAIDDIDSARKGRLFCAGNKRINVPLLGKVKIHLHRPLDGNPKTMRIIREGDRWFIRLTCTDVPSKPPLPKTCREVGIDCGLLQFAATSDGEIFENPRPYKEAKRALGRTLRRINRRMQLGSQRRRKAVLQLQRQHAHIANIRRENHITVARSLVAHYDTIYVEDLSLRGLTAGPLATSFRDAAFGNFLKWLRTKAEDAAREIVEVNPNGTSQTCPDCGTVAKKTLKERVHRCPCGLVCDRDVAAARMVLKFGRNLRGDAASISAHHRSAEIESDA